MFTLPLTSSLSVPHYHQKQYEELITTKMDSVRVCVGEMKQWISIYLFMGVCVCVRESELSLALVALSLWVFLQQQQYHYYLHKPQKGVCSWSNTRWHFDMTV